MGCIESDHCVEVLTTSIMALSLIVIGVLIFVLVRIEYKSKKEDTEE